jgi:hypothetical protein
MKRNAIFSLLIVLFAIFFLACGESDDEDVIDKPTQSTTQTQTPDDEIAVKQEEIDFEVEAAAIREVLTLHASAIGTKDTDKIMAYWLKSESDDVFTAWTFWAGAFERNVGWKAIKNGWAGIFRLHGGVMTVSISSVAIDSRAKNSTLRASYKWAVSGDLIAAMEKDKDEWKIRAIDYTNEKFGKQIKELKDPAYKNP